MRKTRRLLRGLAQVCAYVVWPPLDMCNCMFHRNGKAWAWERCG